MDELLDILKELKPDVDFETEKDGCVTVRDRDTMEQVRIKIEEIETFINEKIEF